MGRAGQPQRAVSVRLGAQVQALPRRTDGVTGNENPPRDESSGRIFGSARFGHPDLGAETVEHFARIEGANIVAGLGAAAGDDFGHRLILADGTVIPVAVAPEGVVPERIVAAPTPARAAIEAPGRAPIAPWSGAVICARRTIGVRFG